MTSRTGHDLHRPDHLGAGLAASLVVATAVSGPDEAASQRGQHKGKNSWPCETKGGVDGVSYQSDLVGRRSGNRDVPDPDRLYTNQGQSPLRRTDSDPAAVSGPIPHRRDRSGHVRLPRYVARLRVRRHTPEPG
jgi:hypothetical protein